MDAVLTPALAAAAAGGSTLLARDYLRRRLTGQEDRFMALCCRDDWNAGNMEVVFRFAPGRDAPLKRVFRRRLATLVAKADPATSLFHEHGEILDGRVVLHRDPEVDLDTLSQPDRQGVRLVWDVPGEIRIVWNHVQADGVAIWDSFRGAFDPSPPLLDFRSVPTPPPFLPELLGALPAMRRLLWRGALSDRCGDHHASLVQRWPTAPIRALKDELGLDFNLVSAALCVRHVLDRHPEVDALCVGLIVFLPFLRSRNRYGVVGVRVRRDGLAGLARQIRRQTRFPSVRWGASSLQSYGLGCLPDAAFAPAAVHLRRQIDVLISNLPVGSTPALVDGIPVTLSLRSWQPGAPYYFLLAGTRDGIDLSINTRFEQDPGFMAEPL